MDLATLTAGDFQPRVGEPFVLFLSADSRFDTSLIEVTEGGAGVSRSQFSLVFRGGPPDPLPQAIYRLENPTMGALDVFLVPIGPDSVGQRYQAVFG